MRGKSRGRLRAILATLAIAMFALVATAMAALPSNGTTFKGQTSQSHTIKFTYDSHKISGTVKWDADCDHGTLNNMSTSFHKIAVTKKGKIKGGFGSYNADLGSGYTATVLFAGPGGKFESKKSASGTLSATATVKDSSDQVVAHCDTKTIHWAAKAQ